MEFPQIRDRTSDSGIGRQILYDWATKKALKHFWVAQWAKQKYVSALFSEIQTSFYTPGCMWGSKEREWTQFLHRIA